MQSQTQRVLDYIKANGSITDQEAQILRVRRLASRIFDLKQSGVAFNKVDKKDNFGQKYRSYSLA